MKFFANGILLGEILKDEESIIGMKKSTIN